MTPEFEQVGRDSNPQPTVLETVTLPIELPTYSESLLGFLVNGMLAAERAELLVLYARGVKTLILVAVIVALIAFGAFERDEFSRHFLS